MTDLLRAEGLSTFYGASQILFDVDVVLAEKRTLALLGRNGAGKSTTMKTLAGIVPARSGRIFFAGRDITHAPPHARAKLGLAYVPEDRQADGFVPLLGVAENATMTITRRLSDRFGVLSPARRAAAAAAPVAAGTLS